MTTTLIIVEYLKTVRHFVDLKSHYCLKHQNICNVQVGMHDLKSACLRDDAEIPQQASLKFLDILFG